MDHRTNFNLEDLLPEHSRLIPRHHPDLAAYSAGLPPTWQAALQEPGDPGQAAALIWEPITDEGARFSIPAGKHHPGPGIGSFRFQKFTTLPALHLRIQAFLAWLAGWNPGSRK